MIGKIYKKIVNKKIISNKNSRLISLLHGSQADSVANDQCYSEHLLQMIEKLITYWVQEKTT